MGDTKIEWDPQAVAQGDPEAIAAVREAEKLLAESFAKGYTAIAVAAPGEPGIRTGRLDPDVTTVAIPRFVGG